MTVNYNETVGFKNLSAIDFQTKSCLGESNVRFGAFSFTTGFNPIYSVNPYNSTAAANAAVLATLIQVLHEKKIIS